MFKSLEIAELQVINGGSGWDAFFVTAGSVAVAWAAPVAFFAPPVAIAMVLVGSASVLVGSGVDVELIKY